MGDYLAELEKANVLNQLKELWDEIVKLKGKTVSVNSIEDFSDDLGLFRIAELLSAETGFPDDGAYSGLFWSTVGYIFNNMLFHMGAINNGTPEILFSATGDGAYFSKMRAWIDKEGITGNDYLKWLVRHIATNNGLSRVGYLGMEYPEEDGISARFPVWQLTYSTVPGEELVINGGAEKNDFTGWIKTDAKGTWSIDDLGEDTPNGRYRFKYSGDEAYQQLDSMYQEIAVTPGEYYLFKASINRPDYVDPGIDLFYYDSSHNYVSGEPYNFNVSINGNDNYLSYYFKIPSGVSYIRIILKPIYSHAEDWSVYYDSISLVQLSVYQRLWMGDDGVHISNLIANYETDQLVFGRDKNRDTSADYLYQEQRFLLHRKIKLIGIKWDIRYTGAYTCNIYDLEGNLIVSSGELNINAPLLEATFPMFGNELLPGYYRIRMTCGTSVRWYDSSQSNFVCSDYETIGYYYYPTESSYKSPFKLVYYREKP